MSKKANPKLERSPGSKVTRRHPRRADGTIMPMQPTEPEAFERLVADGTIRPIAEEPQAPAAPEKTVQHSGPRMAKAIPQQPDDSAEIVVFAFRLSRAERDEIHAATGSAKASKFIRTLALAGARGDMKAVQEVIDEVHATRK